MYRPELFLTEQSACRMGEARHAISLPMTGGAWQGRDRFSTALPQRHDHLPAVTSFGRSSVILDDVFFYAGGMINWLRVP